MKAGQLLRFHLTVLAIASSSCTCGKKQAEPDAFADYKKLFDVLLKELPASSVEEPLAAIPASLPYVASSPDPEAYRAWVAGQPFMSGLMGTALFDDLRSSALWRTIDGLRRQASRAAAFVPDADDAQVMWRGPTAVGADALKGADPKVVLVKAVDPKVRSLVRLAAAFAMIKSKEGGPELTEREVGKVKVRSVRVQARVLSFALFRDLVIAGTDEDLVARAAALAQRDAKEPDHPATELRERGLLPDGSAAGIHFSASLEGSELAEIAGLRAIGFSLLADPTSPLTLRRIGPGGEDIEVGALLRYLPASAYVALLDSASPKETILGAASKGIEAAMSDDDVAPVSKKKPKPPSLRGFELEQAIAAQLEPGLLVALTAPSDREGRLCPLIAFRQRDPKKLEPAVRRLLEGLIGKRVERTVLEGQDGALLLASGDSGPSAALSKDALLFALDPRDLRLALDAGAGTVPSLRDRKGVDMSGTARGAVWLDLDRAAQFLGAFYREAFHDDGSVPASEASQVLGPVFDALGKGGALFARLSGKSEAGAEGALRGVP